jgi:hypothetical protein
MREHFFSAHSPCVHDFLAHTEHAIKVQNGEDQPQFSNYKKISQSLSPLSRRGRKSHTFWAPLTPDTPSERMILRYRYSTPQLQVQYSPGSGTVLPRFRYSTPQVQVQYSPGSGTVLPRFRYSTPLVQVLYSPGSGTVLPRFRYSTPQVQVQYSSGSGTFLALLWFLDAPKTKKKTSGSRYQSRTQAGTSQFSCRCQAKSAYFDTSYVFRCFSRTSCSQVQINSQV